MIEPPLPNEGLPPIKTVHKAIRNYLVNELGLNRESLDATIQMIIKRHVTVWFNEQLNTRHSFLRKFMTDIIGQVAERHLQRSLTVALSKVETKAEIVIVDGRMNEADP